MAARFPLIIATSLLVACGARGGYDWAGDGGADPTGGPNTSSGSGGASSTSSSSSSSSSSGTGGVGVGGEATGGVAQGGAGATGGGGSGGTGGSGGGPLCQGLSANANLISESNTGNIAPVALRSAISMGLSWRHTVVWLDDSDNLYARMYDFADPITLPTQVASNLSFARSPAVEQLHNGGALVLWTHSNNVSLRRINGSGSAIGPVVTVDVANEFVNLPPAVDSAPDNSFIVAYRSQFPAAIRAAKFDANVQLLGTVTATGNNEQAYGSPDVAMAEDGSSAVAWRAPGGSPSFVYVQRYDAQGGVAGQRITATPSNAVAADSPSIGMTLDGRFVVSWVDTSGNVRARTFSANGQASSNAILVNTSGFAFTSPEPFTGENAPGTRLAVADNGSFVVSWVNTSNMFRTWRRFGAGGNPITTQQEVPGASLTWAADVSVEPCGGRSTMTWVDTSSGTVSRALFGP